MSTQISLCSIPALHEQTFSCSSKKGARMSDTVECFPEMILVCAVVTEMDISPDKRQKAPQSSQPHKQQLISERQQRFVTQMLSKNGVWLFQSHPCCDLN